MCESLRCALAQLGEDLAFQSHLTDSSFAQRRELDIKSMEDTLDTCERNTKYLEDQLAAKVSEVQQVHTLWMPVPDPAWLPQGQHHSR